MTATSRHPLRRAASRVARILLGIFIILTFVFGLGVWAALVLQLL